MPVWFWSGLLSLGTGALAVAGGVAGTMWLFWPAVVPVLLRVVLIARLKPFSLIWLRLVIAAAIAGSLAEPWYIAVPFAIGMMEAAWGVYWLGFHALDALIRRAVTRRSSAG